MARYVDVKKRKGLAFVVISVGICSSTVLSWYFGLLALVQFDHHVDHVDHVVTVAKKYHSGIHNDGAYYRDPKVFGLVHMANTAGSFISSYLSAHFERVCSNKGYSYDSTTFYRKQNYSSADIRAHQNKCDMRICNYHKDTIAMSHPGFHRGFVPFDVIQEIGFEDCDYVALENSANVWGQLADVMNESPKMSTQPSLPSSSDPLELELHVPCRDPIDHLLSQCHYHKLNFSCATRNSPEDWQSNVHACISNQNRFNIELWEAHPQLDVKCFPTVPVEPYLDYMSKILQPKRLRTAFNPYKSKTPRDKPTECLHSYPDFMNQIREYMQTNYSYFNWCRSCLASSHDNLLFVET